MSKIPTFSCAYLHTSDINSHPHGAAKWTGLATICVNRAAALLQRDPGGYGDLQRHSMSSLLTGMLATHRNIRKILSDGWDDPGVVDALGLARLQLETLYVICLMVEDPGNVDWYLRDGWRKQYTRFLLTREECKGLARYDRYIDFAPVFLSNLRDLIGITLEQQLTIEHDELGTPLPPGFIEQQIRPFPTPGRAIEIVSANRAAVRAALP